MSEPTRTGATIQALKAIPRERWATKVKRTVTGLFVAGVCIAASKYFGAPWWVPVVGGVVGATIWSGEMVLLPLKLLRDGALDGYERFKRSGQPPAEG